MTSPSAMTRFTSDELIILSGRDICRTEWAVKRIRLAADFLISSFSSLMGLCRSFKSGTFRFRTPDGALPFMYRVVLRLHPGGNHPTSAGSIPEFKWRLATDRDGRPFRANSYGLSPFGIEPVHVDGVQSWVEFLEPATGRLQLAVGAESAILAEGEPDREPAGR